MCELNINMTVFVYYKWLKLLFYYLFYFIKVVDKKRAFLNVSSHHNPPISTNILVKIIAPADMITLINRQ